MRKISIKKLIIWGGILVFISGASLSAQTLGEIPGLRERAVLMRIVSRIVEQNQQVSWDSEYTQETISGRPVGLKLAGSNLVVAVQFTPFLRSSGRHTLVAQCQVWVNNPGEGISYYTTMQTIHLELEEQVFFFPLGPRRAENEPHIEIQLVLEPFSEDTVLTRNRSRRNAASP